MGFCLKHAGHSQNLNVPLSLFDQVFHQTLTMEPPSRHPIQVPPRRADDAMIRPPTWLCWDSSSMTSTQMVLSRQLPLHRIGLHKAVVSDQHALHTGLYVKGMLHVVSDMETWTRGAHAGCTDMQSVCSLTTLLSGCSDSWRLLWQQRLFGTGQHYRRAQPEQYGLSIDCLADLVKIEGSEECMGGQKGDLSCCEHPGSKVNFLAASHVKGINRRDQSWTDSRLDGKIWQQILAIAQGHPLRSLLTRMTYRVDQQRQQLVSPFEQQLQEIEPLLDTDAAKTPSERCFAITE